MRSFTKRAKPLFIDTTAFCAARDEDDLHHDEAVEALKKLRGRKLITTDWVIAESGALIRRKLGFKESRLFLEAVEEGRATGVLEIVFVDEDLLREEMALFLEWANPKLSLVDAVSIALYKKERN